MRRSPLWATRRLAPDVYTMAETLQFDEHGKTQAEVVNEELSWEPFWVSIETFNGDENSVELEGASATAATWHSPSKTTSITASPESGTLAPRGGSNDYTDRCRIKLERVEQAETLAVPTSASRTTSQTGMNEPHEASQSVSCYYLVVRTEQDHWVWRLQQ